MLETQLIVVKELVAAVSRVEVLQCVLCAAPIPVDGAPLCPLCLVIEASRERAYREEKEQARRPF